MGSRGKTRARYGEAAAAAVAAGVVVALVLPAVRPGFELAAEALAVGAALLRGRIEQGRRRAGWLLAGSGILVWFVADAFSSAESGTPILAVVHAVDVLGFLPVLAGLWLLCRPQGEHLGVTAVLDGAIIVGAAGCLLWYVAVQPVTDARGVGMVRMVTAQLVTLPLLGLLGFLVTVTLGRTVITAAAGALLAAASVALGVQTASAVIDARGASSTVPDAGWVLVFGLVTLAAAFWPHDEQQHAPFVDVGRVSVPRAVMLTIAMLTPALLGALHEQRQSRDAGLELTLLGAVVAVLVVCRLLLTAHGSAAAREQLQARDRFQRALLAGASTMALVTTVAGTVLHRSPGTADGLFLAPDGELDVHPGDLALLRAKLRQAARLEGQAFTLEYRTTAHRWVEARVTGMVDDPDVGGIVVNLTEVTERVRFEMEMSRLSLHDALTGLPNRTLLQDRLQTALGRRAETGGEVFLLLVDLDRFQSVNEAYGHEVADQVLSAVGSLLRVLVGTNGVVARMHGDEFAVLLEQTDVAGAKDLARRMLAACERPVDVGADRVPVSLSIGLAVAAATDSAEQVLRNAELAAHDAKAHGGEVIVFLPEMQRLASVRAQIERELRGSLTRGELWLAYQPVVELDGGRVVGFEALLRWSNPLLGEVPPSTFVSVAEQSGLIHAIGGWALREACAQAVAWDDGSAPAPSVAVNVSVVQLAAVDFVDLVADVLVVTGLDPSRLCLEITESVLAEDRDGALRRLARLKALGVRIAIDDFGTGYSSMSYLSRMPADILKIDRSFIEALVDTPTGRSVVEGLLGLARAVDLEVVAEGIELPSQLDWLREHGCGYGQGYLFARPKPAAEATALLAAPALQSLIA